MTKLDNMRELLAEWLVGTVFVSVSFAAGFTLRFERPETSYEKPNVLYLDIKATARVGDESKWKQFVDSLPFKARRDEIDEPALAYRLMLLLGSTVSDIELKDDSSIYITTTDHETLVVMGVEDVWEESWALAESKEIAGENARSIICTSHGDVYLT